MESKSRVDCEADDLIRLFRSKRVLDIQLAGESLAERVQELLKQSEPKWNDAYATGMELGEQLVLSAFCIRMRDYLLEKESEQKPKKHERDCSLKDTVPKP